MTQKENIQCILQLYINSWALNNDSVLYMYVLLYVVERRCARLMIRLMLNFNTPVSSSMYSKEASRDVGLALYTYVFLTQFV